MIWVTASCPEGQRCTEPSRGACCVWGVPPRSILVGIFLQGDASCSMDYSRKAVAAGQRVCVEVGERYIHLSLYDQARSRPQSKVKDSRPSLMTLQCAGRSLGLCLELWCLWLSWGPSWSVTRGGLSLLPAPSPPGPQQRGPFHHFSFLDSGFGNLPSLSDDYFSFPQKKINQRHPSCQWRSDRL